MSVVQVSPMYDIEALKRARKDKGLTTEKLAWRAGLHRTSISAWERGEYTPDYASAAMWASALGLNIDEYTTGYKQ